MRFIRLASLVAGVVLLLSGIANVIGRRAELQQDRDRTLETAARLGAARTDATIARIAAVLAIAPGDASADDLAAALGLVTCTVSAGASVAPGASCSAGPSDGAVIDVVGRAVDAALDRDVPAAAIGNGPDGVPAVVVVAVGVGDGARYAIAPLAALLAGDDVSLRLVAGADAADGTAATVNGHRVAAVPLETELVEGRHRLEATGPSTVALGADERWLIGAQVVLGAALLGLAAANFVSEHRALRRRATIDQLTALPNRAEFHRLATEALARARRAGDGACVMLVDLDRFKAINDTSGHHVGDLVLAAAAARLRGAVRATDLVARWGGDEFVVLLDGVGDPDAVGARAEAIEAALSSDGSALAGAGVTITASVGAALFPRHGADLDTLVRAADAAMYAAKAAGDPHRLAAT